MPTVQRSDDTAFRPDLEGLRGMAILLVLLCHAGIPGAGAGFIGVDVFFVLSGFLITGLLVGDHERTGRIHLGAFYARRIRRILPAALFVLVSTLAAAALLVSPLDLPRIADDGLAAGLSLANVRFALGATDYFAPMDPSPLLHYWSLGVEEQFYLLWPCLLLVASRSGRPRAAMAAVMGAIVLASFAASVALTDVSQPWAYYMLPTRAWELAAGGILALAIPVVGWRVRRAAAPVGWLGVVLLICALVVIGPATPYPGLAALLPAIGALAIIGSGGRAGSPGSTVLGRLPLRWLGRISFSLYLWHWPILVLAPVAMGLTSSEDGSVGADLPIRLGLVALAVVLAGATWLLVEEPFRRGHVTQRVVARRFALGGAVLLVLTIGSMSIGAVAAGDLRAATSDEGDATDLSPATDGTGVSIIDASSDADPPSATDRPPSSSPTASATPLVPPDGGPRPAAKPAPKPRTSGHVPAGLAPALTNARTDDDRLIGDGCGLSLAGSRPPRCTYGDPHGALTVALVGDSHAAHWFPAFEVLAKRHGWRLVPFTKFSCAFVDLPIWSPYLKREYTECAAWRDNVVDRLAKLQPDLVVIASDRWFPVVADRDEDPKRQGDAMARLIKRVPGEIAIMVDTPRSDYDVPACLAMHRDAIERCTTSRADAFGWRNRRREKEAVKRTTATLVDMSDVICPTDPCPPIIGKKLVYRDHHHLTATFVVSIADDLDAVLPTIGPG